MRSAILSGFFESQNEKPEEVKRHREKAKEWKSNFTHGTENSKVMMGDDKFSKGILDYLLECQADKPNILKRKESRELEFKANFNWGDKAEYGKLFCSFANNKGGYIVFGVRDKPRELFGLQTDNFSRKDPVKMTEYLNSHFSPTIEWASCDHEIEGKKFGIIYIFTLPKKNL